jgi:ribulose-5-phosphate 4-epimerase/fuculose-1-phosphate aldolase
MFVHSLPKRATDAHREIKTQLAAAHRLAVLHELDEGIDNHFTVAVPNQPGRYIILPFGRHWSEATASDMVIFDDEGHTVDGEAVVELSAWCIHAPVHRITGAKVVMHTHQTWALALNMLKDNRILNATQTAAFLDGRVAYDDHYAGTADFPAEGERLAKVVGDKGVLMMKNHGVLVVGDTVAQAYRRLYKLERICRTQVLAMSTGRELQVLSDEVVAAVKAPAPNETHTGEERDRLFFEAMMRLVDRVNPGFNA